MSYEPAPPLSNSPRDILINVLVYHWRTDTSGCGCGWTVLGASHAEHVADVYEASVAARADQ